MSSHRRYRINGKNSKQRNNKSSVLSVKKKQHKTKRILVKKKQPRTLKKSQIKGGTPSAPLYAIGAIVLALASVVGGIALSNRYGLTKPVGRLVTFRRLPTKTASDCSAHGGLCNGEGGGGGEDSGLGGEGAGGE